MEAAGDAVRRVTAAGVLPAGMEIMDNFMINAVNDLFGHEEYPRDAAAVLLIEVDGQAAEVEVASDRAASLCRDAGARGVRRAQDAADRALLWKGRKSAFAAVGQISPTYYVQDGVVPRSSLPTVLAAIAALSRRSPSRSCSSPPQTRVPTAAASSSSTRVNPAPGCCHLCRDGPLMRPAGSADC